MEIIKDTDNYNLIVAESMDSDQLIYQIVNKQYGVIEAEVSMLYKAHEVLAMLEMLLKNAPNLTEQMFNEDPSYVRSLAIEITESDENEVPQELLKKKTH